MTDTLSIAIVNARVWTADPRRPWADAVLVAGARLAAVGTSAEVKKRASPATRVVDARGRTVVPREWAGMLRAGLPADLVLLDRDLPRVTSAWAHEAQVVLAISGGAVVHGATEAGADPIIRSGANS